MIGLLIVAGIAVLFFIGFLGGVVGGRRRTEQTSDPAARTALENLKASLGRLQREQQNLLERIARLEGKPTPESVVSPDAVAPAQPAEILLPQIDEPIVATTRIAAPPPPSPPIIARPVTPPGPVKTEPNWFMRWLLGGNTVVRVGIIILFFGVAFLFKYTYERVQLPPELRLGGVALLAIGLLTFGWRLREKRAGYAVALQGGGVGVLYLTVFAALRLYQVLPAGAAMAMLVIVAVSAATLAVLQDSRALAILGTSGGFLAPVLASSGNGSHVMLFSYYTLLNAGVIGIVYWRAWRELNVLGFVFTFVISALWGARAYQPELFATTEPFLILFFLIYVAVPILYARRQAFELRAYVDATLVFGTPLVAFGLQYQLIHRFEYGMAFSALALGTLYLSLVAILHRRAPALRMLVESFLALGVVFATLAIPLAFEGRWTSAAWSLEAAAILWIGVRQQRLGARLFAMLLQVGGGLMFLCDMPHGGGLPMLNIAFLGCAFIAFAGAFSAWYVDQHADRVRVFERGIGIALLIWGVGWWLFGGITQIDEHVSSSYQLATGLAFFAVSYAGLAAFSHRTQWRNGGKAALSFGIFLALAALDAVDNSAHPLRNLGFVAWPIAFVAHLFILRKHEARAPTVAAWLHALGVWLLALLAGSELAWWIGKAVNGAQIWEYIALVIVPGALLIALTRLPQRWPFITHARSYVIGGGAPLAVALLVWTGFTNWVSDGHVEPLPYVPVLNPLDIALTAALLITAYWTLMLRKRDFIKLQTEERTLIIVVFSALGFTVLNGILLRSLHHFGGVTYDLDAMMASRLVQTAVSIFWTILALVIMLAGTRRRVRKLWICGAALMAAVVVKLFLVDLSDAGSIERVVSFMGVGLLMLVIGYLAPVPPKREEVTA